MLRVFGLAFSGDYLAYLFMHSFLKPSFSFTHFQQISQSKYTKSYNALYTSSIFVVQECHVSKHGRNKFCMARHI